MNFTWHQRVTNSKTRKYLLKQFIQPNKRKLELTRLRRNKMIEERRIEHKEPRKHKIKLHLNDL